MLADEMLPPEFLKFRVTKPMFEVGRIFADGRRRARSNTASARSAAENAGRPRRLEGHFRKNRNETNAGAELRRDQKIMAADPTQSGQTGDLFMGDMSQLVFPIDDLRGGYGESLEAEILETAGQEKRRPIEKIIHLAVMVEIKRRGMVLDIVEDGVGELFGQNDGTGKTAPQTARKEELIADGNNVGDAEKRKTQFAAKRPDRLIVLGFHGGEGHCIDRPHRCQRNWMGGRRLFDSRIRFRYI